MSAGQGRIWFVSMLCLCARPGSQILDCACLQSEATAVEGAGAMPPFEAWSSATCAACRRRRQVCRRGRHSADL